jgi:integrase
LLSFTASRVPKPEFSFYDFAEFEQLVAGAAKVSPMHLAFVLLAGEAGLRRGELVALEQGDIGGAEVVVRRNEWHKKASKPIVGTPKGGNLRRVPMTTRLRAALDGIKHLRGARVLWSAERPALVPPPDFATVTCPTAPICSPDMGVDLSSVLDIRFVLDLASNKED